MAKIQDCIRAGFNTTVTAVGQAAQTVKTKATEVAKKVAKIAKDIFNFIKVKYTAFKEFASTKLKQVRAHLPSGEQMKAKYEVYKTVASAKLSTAKTQVTTFFSNVGHRVTNMFARAPQA